MCRTNERQSTRPIKRSVVEAACYGTVEPSSSVQCTAGNDACIAINVIVIPSRDGPVPDGIDRVVGTASDKAVPEGGEREREREKGSIRATRPGRRNTTKTYSPEIML